MIRAFSRLWTVGVSMTCLLVVGLGEVMRPQAIMGAEDIQVMVGGPLILSIGLDDLEQFAETGEKNGDLALVARFLDDAILAQLQQQLTQPIPMDLQLVDTLAYSPLGRDAIANLGKVIRVHPDINGFYGLRAAVINAAANAGPEGWTILDALRQFPSDSIDIKLEDLLELRQALAIYFGYNQAVVTAIQQQAQEDAIAHPLANSIPLVDLNQPGPHTVGQETLTVEAQNLRQTATGLAVNYDFSVDVYYPENIEQPLPIVIISHGFGDVKNSFFFMAEHLASHGFVTILPEHVGSDLAYRQLFLEGRLNTLLSPMEFVDRPQDISVLIDELEQLTHQPTSQSPPQPSRWTTWLDLDRIGIMGDSFGGTTALALAGAEINYGRLVKTCDRQQININIALYLQCRAQFLPPANYQLRDERIKTVVTAHPLGGGLYGPEGMSQINIPFLMISGSDDIISPVIPEQIYPFIWIPSGPKYLALLQRGTHFTSKPGRLAAEGFLSALVGDHRDIGTRYSKILVTAFLQAHLNDRPDYLPYLSAAYGQTLSANQPLQVDIVRSLSPERLRANYDRTPPIPIIPPPVAPPPQPRNESVLTEIQRTGVLKVAFRKDAPPFGYINQTSEWDGYCGNMAIALSDYLADELDIPLAVELVELTSTLQNRFDLVRNGTVHLECGPNTIRTDVAGITFSQAMLTASTRFLVTQDNRDRINPNVPQSNRHLGVLLDTTTETFLAERYPEASTTRFTGADGRQDAVQALVSGQIDAFVGDDILSYAELIRQGLNVSDFALLPETPLTCEFYGLILPEGDRTWKTTVDKFLTESPAENNIFNHWFNPAIDYTLDITDYCLNQR